MQPMQIYLDAGLVYSARHSRYTHFKIVYTKTLTAARK